MICSPLLTQAGLDSLGAVELRNAVGTAFGLDLPATVTFDHPTIAALAAYVAEHSAAQAAEIALLVVGPDGLAMVEEDSGASSATVTALAAVSCRYPAPMSGIHLAPDTATAGQGNSDLAGFQAAAEAGANMQSLVPPQRWDVDAVYSPGEWGWLLAMNGCGGVPRRVTINLSLAR